MSDLRFKNTFIWLLQNFLLIFIFWFVLENVQANAAQHKNYSINSNSPYPLFLKSFNFKSNKLQTSSQWSRLFYFCDHNNNPDWDYQGSESYRYAVNFALCYQVKMSLGMQDDAYVYAEKSLHILNNNLLPFINYKNDSGYGIRNYGPALALVYSWLHSYPGFLPEVKKSTRIRMSEWLSWFSEKGYSNNQPVANYHAGYVLASTLIGVATYHDNNNGAEAFKNTVLLFNNSKKLFDAIMPGGHWPEGWSYGVGVYDAYALSTLALTEATNMSGFKDFKWLKNNIYLKSAALTPDGKYFYDDGLWSLNRHGVPTVTDMYTAGYLYNWTSVVGLRARQYLHDAKTNEKVSEWKSFIFSNLDKDSKKSGIHSQSASSYMATGLGLVLMRDSSDGESSTWGSFISGPYLSYQREQDLDQGHMEIYKSAPLLIDAGHGLYNPDNLKATKLHNTYTLTGRTDVDYDAQRSFANIKDCKKRDIGIKQYSEMDDGLLISGEFSNAYRAAPAWDEKCKIAPLKKLTRTIFYLRPNLFFIFDHIVKTSSQSKVVPHFNLNFPTMPDKLSSDSRKLEVNNLTGRLHVETIFPEKSVSILQSGAKSGALIESWHLDVSNPDNTLMAYSFLHVIRAGLNNSNYKPPVTISIKGENILGVLLGGLISSELKNNAEVVVLFADVKAKKSNLKLSYKLAKALKSRVTYVFNLQPDTRYKVEVEKSDNNISTVSIKHGPVGILSNPQGVLKF